jgi:hypothetical protein
LDPVGSIPTTLVPPRLDTVAAIGRVLDRERHENKLQIPAAFPPLR